ncbi:EEF1A lysine methyltransferase 3-like [Hemiscyllium ocellatum]|uniref:EEF1A lysine methyltransferase 3-like n=1 Tax=Hemiscyllium ocellatum TaxID=170820 RepID=UPI00296756FA|nr:EEF1A lysine methyltransferase 3-like [Hemiscyllium ocellatum]
MSESKIASVLKKPMTEVFTEADNLKYKLFYPVCGFLLEIALKPIVNTEFGTMVWNAGLGLCQYFEEQKMDFSHKKVIELGAGTGILSILTVLLGGDVTITDNPQLLQQIELNVSANIPSSMKSRVQIRALSWGLDESQFPSDYDYILGGDIVYNRSSLPLILKTLQHLCNESTVIYFASTMSISRELITSSYRTLFQYFDSDLVCRYENVDVNLYRMTKKQSQTQG